MSNENLTAILNKFKLSPNESNYQAALYALFFYKVQWSAFVDNRKPLFMEATTSMLPFTITHNDPGNKHSLLVVAGEDTYQIAPGASLPLQIKDAHTRLTVTRVLHTPGDPELMGYEYNAQEPEPETAAS